MKKYLIYLGYILVFLSTLAYVQHKNQVLENQRKQAKQSHISDTQSTTHHTHYFNIEN